MIYINLVFYSYIKITLITYKKKMSSYLTAVNPSLSAIGVNKDTLYYDEEDIKVESVEFCNRVGRYQRSLTTLQFGGSSDISVPNYNFIGSTYLQVEMPVLDPAVSLCDNWLVHAVESINYSWGSSNISLVTINSIDMLHHNYMACETREKRQKMVLLGGGIKAKGDTQDTRTATICLKFPWSTIAASEQKRLFDLKILDTNMLIQIKWATKDKFLGWLTADAGLVPDSFTSAKIILKQNELTNHNDSLATRMKVESKLNYNYPFVHLSTGTSHRFITVEGENQVRFELNSFLNSDLLGILFSVVDLKDLSRSSDVAHSFPNPFNLQKVKDISIDFNGQKLMDYSDDLNQLANLNISKGDTTCDIHKLVPATGAADGDDKDLSYVWYIPFTQYKELTFEEAYCNVIGYKSQPVDLSFTFTAPATAPTMICRTTYLYNAYTSTSDFTSTMYFS